MTRSPYRERENKIDQDEYGLTLLKGKEKNKDEDRPS